MPDQAQRRLLEDTGLPFANAGAIDQDEPNPCIVFRNSEAGRLLAAHLWELGHRRVGILAAHPSNHQCEERLRGMRAVFAENGAPLDNAWVRRAPTPEINFAVGYEFAAELLDAHPDLTALMAINDMMAIGALRCVGERGRAVPAAFSVTGFDDLCVGPTVAEGNRIGAYITPQLTTIRTPIEQGGRAAAQLLIDLVERKVDPAVRHVVELKPELVVRESTGAARG
ncbi:MAG: LacI family DNA-binding transcriptional regulator [Candidatus Hydrogenedentota bacterium]